MQKRSDGTESAIHGLREQILKMKVEDWKALFMLLISYAPGKVWKIFNRNIWVVSEYDKLARDNGFFFFQYMRLKHGELTTYYPICKSSPDYKKIEKLGGYVEFGSFKHYCLFWAAKYYIGTTKCYGFPYRRICEDLVQWKVHSFKYIFLNHGLTRGYSSIVDGNETRYDLLVTCATKDAEIIVRENQQSKESVKVLGFARHDTLLDSIVDKNQLLIMPTWRKWLDCRESQDVSLFLNSDYYLKYKELLNDKELNDILEKYDLHLIFYLHEYAQKYSKYFKTTSKRIIIGTRDKYEIQELLKQSVMLITDYSSVCYDFAYMRKPVLYYQFDKKIFEKLQYCEGKAFTYEKDGFGNIVFDRKSLICEMEKACEKHFVMDEIYIERVKSFFQFHDTNNCERIYRAIIKIK